MAERILIAAAQMNCTVGDLAGNAARILDFVERSRAARADLVLTPEFSLCGYPPEDLVLREGFLADCRRELERMAPRVRGIGVVVGFPELAADGKRYNAAALLRDGRIAAVARKRELPNYDVFDEKRYFEAGEGVCLVEVKGVRFGLAICEDVWFGRVPAAAKAAGAQAMLSINASPYHTRKQAARHGIFREWIRATGLPMVAVNLVGGQDELVFDGASCVLDASGALVRQSPFFEESLELFEFDGARPVSGAVAPELALEAEIYAALRLGTRDYLGKNGFPGAIIGLSGGVDSALTLAIACDALGAERVRAVMMPSRYTRQMSLDDAAEMARRLGVRYDIIPIQPVCDAFAAALAPQFAGRAPDVAEENLQARVRGTLLMALSNKFGSIVLTTGNKSEMAVGYSTLYGDMAGGFAVIKDLTKTLVWRLSRYRNTVSDAIPGNIITRAPSAELRPDQTDQDSLPPYDVLDGILEAYMEHNLGPRQIVAQGFAAADVRRVVGLIRQSEYKRRQAPPGVRITLRGFGKDWRYPITSHYRDDGGLSL
ncbi:MAG TPA: NAD+ synthase [Burkholderiales bacterium]|nr:NAD+ synthase [Burkholderiales bacterium]